MSPLLIASLLMAPSAGPSVGAAAPDFTLPASSGKTHSLSDFRGKTVVLEWTNPGCPFVVKHYKSGNMQALQKWATEKGVIWLTVDSSAPGKQGYLDAVTGEAARKEGKWSSTALLLDPDGTVGKLYAAKTTPHLYVVDPAGKLAYMGGIDDNPSPDPATIKESKNYVKAALEDLLAGRAVSVPTSKPYGCGVKYKD